MEAVDDVGQEDCEAVEVVEEAVYAERRGRASAAAALAALLLELTHVLTRHEPGGGKLGRKVGIDSVSQLRFRMKFQA